MIYDRNGFTTKQSRAAAIAFAQNPPSRVTFSPVPHKLLRVTENLGDEYVFADTAGTDGMYGDYAGLRFDPWQKGDLVAIAYKHSAWHQGKGHTQYETWYIGRRATVPSAVRQAYDIGGISKLYSHQSLTLYRVAYHYHGTAAKLIGHEFETREALEHALEHGVQSIAIAAE